MRNIYDGLGNLLRREAWRGNLWKVEVENTYDNLMRISQVKDANGNTTSYIYDDFDRVIKITYADGSNIQYIYDDVNNTKTTINEEGHSYTEYFDKLGRVIKKEANDGEKVITTKNEYDYVGNLTKVTDANGNETKYVYDDLCRLIKVIDAKGQETNYSYDELNELVKISTNEYTRTKEYDQLGRVIKSCDESLKPSYFNYDGNGNLVWSKDKEGQTQTNNYNNLNRLNERYFGNEKTAYEYDAAGRIKIVKEYKDKQNPQHELTRYDYYTDGRLMKETLSDGKSISYSYDPVGNVTEMNDYFGNKVSYTYDQRDRTNTINSNGKTFTYEYYKDGMIKGLKYPNPNLKAEYTYDWLNRIKSLNNVLGSSNFSAYSYKLDAQNNITEKNDNGSVLSFNYDSLNRIKSSVDSSKNQQHTYDYDIKSNITKEEANYNIFPRINIGQYKWNPLGLVESFTNSNGQIYNYIYNYKGLRTKKINSNETISYYYSGDNLIGEEKGTSRCQYIRGHAILAKVVDGKYYYYFYNGHGDVVQITDEAGNIVNRYTYDEWGNITHKEEKMENAITYAGEYYDKESGNYYLKARYYDPSVRRFISRDSYEGEITNPLSLNLYIYCNNNPINMTDPTGYMPELTIPGEIPLPKIEVPIIPKGGIFGGIYIFVKKVFIDAEEVGKHEQELIEQDKLKRQNDSKNDKQSSTKGEGNPKYKPGDKTSKSREFTEHGAERANERGFDSNTIDSIIDNNKAKRVKEIDDQGRVTWRYQDKRGNTVITNEWGDKIVTVYSYPESANGGNYIPKKGSVK